MIEARIRIPTKSREMSRSIIRCVEPDNKGMKGLTVVSRATIKNAYLTISYDGQIETFISSLDDLLRCIQAAKSTLKTISGDR